MDNTGDTGNQCKQDHPANSVIKQRSEKHTRNAGYHHNDDGNNGLEHVRPYLKNWHVENAYKNLVALLGKMDITFGTYLWVPDHNGLDDYIWDFCLNRGESSK